MQRGRVGAVAIGVVALLALLATGCSSTRHVTNDLGQGQQYYLSLGDSYAAGYLASGKDKGAFTKDGFAYLLADKASIRGYDLRLLNFGCAGATSTSMVQTQGCPANARPIEPQIYDTQTQLAAALTFIKAHPGKVGLVTISIGLNDISLCGYSPDHESCLQAALATLKTNLASIVTGIRAALGPAVPIVGISYPDVLLASFLSPNPALQDFAKSTVGDFRDSFNPLLKQAYEASKGTFADVTAASGAYGSFDQQTTVANIGTVPTPVAQVCELTFMCLFGDLHPTILGYRLIANTILEVLPRHP